MLVRRTDLALEARELWQERTGAVTALPGVEAWDSAREGIPVSTVKVLDSRGEEALGRLAEVPTCWRRRMRMARSVDENILTTTGMIFSWYSSARRDFPT